MKDDIQIALVKLPDLAAVIERLNMLASIQLKDVDIKQLEGRTPEDFVQDMFLKLLEGERSWADANTDNLIKFLELNLRSEISNYLKTSKRRNITLESAEDDEFIDDYLEY